MDITVTPEMELMLYSLFTNPKGFDVTSAMMLAGGICVIEFDTNWAAYTIKKPIEKFI